MPTKRKYRFISNWTSTTLQGVRVLPKSGDHLIITKSMKDVMCLHEFGFNALAPNSENIIITKAQYNRLDVRFTNKFCLFDNDLAGVKGAKKYKREFGIKCIFY